MESLIYSSNKLLIHLNNFTYYISILIYFIIINSFIQLLIKIKKNIIQIVFLKQFGICKNDK